MSKNLIFLSFSFAVVFAAACSPEQPASSSNSAAPKIAEAVVPEQPGVKPEVGFDYSPVPDVLVMNMPFHVRADRIYTTTKGEKRRRSTLELLKGDADTVASELGNTLESKGFRAMNLKDKKDGVHRFTYIRKGYGRINLSAQSEVGSKPSNPDAVGVISMDWPLH